MRAAAAPTSARSAPSSTYRAANPAAARPTTSRRSCASTTRRACARFFITDDNFARNKDWEPILDRLIHLREVEKLKFGFIIQVDTLCHKLPNFIEKCRARRRASRVFIGLENINPDNLLGAKKRQNKITEYRKMLLAWKTERRHHLCGLHPRLSERHVRVDHARHRGDQAGTAGRSAGVLLSDAAAGLRGSPEAFTRRACRWIADLNKYDLNHISTDAPEDVARRVGSRLQMAWQHTTRPSTSRRSCAAPSRQERAAATRCS